jgi:hypothetical protein
MSPRGGHTYRRGHTPLRQSDVHLLDRDGKAGIGRRRPS